MTPPPPDDNVPKPEPEPEPDPEPVKNYASYIRCTGESVNLRSGAGTGYAVVGSAEKDTMYVVAGKTGDWYKTYYKNQTVYINSHYTSVFSIEKSDNQAVEDVIWEGYKQLGVPYVYGAVRLHDGYGNLLKGFTKMKYDCSSLVQYVFFEAANVLLQTTTRLQVVQATLSPARSSAAATAFISPILPERIIRESNASGTWRSISEILYPAYVLGLCAH